jgi:hypothetical protein
MLPTYEQPAAKDCSGAKNPFNKFDPGCPEAEPIAPASSQARDRAQVGEPTPGGLY